MDHFPLLATSNNLPLYLQDFIRKGLLIKWTFLLINYIFSVFFYTFSTNLSNSYHWY